MRRRFLALAGLLALSACAAPQEGGGVVTDAGKAGAAGSGQPDPIVVTNAALGAYERVCLTHLTREADRRGALASLGFREAPPALAPSFLAGGPPGTVWLVPQAPPVMVPVAVVTRASGTQCQVMSPVADVATAVARFEAIIGALGRSGGSGFVFRKVRDDSTLPDGVPGRVVSYFASTPSVPGVGLAFLLTVRRPAPNGVALIVTATPARE